MGDSAGPTDDDMVTFTPDVLLAHEVGLLSRTSVRSGYDRLALAVLEAAVDDLRRTTNTVHPRAVELRRQVIAWFQSDNLEGPFTFRMICARFPSLDADGIRDALRRNDWRPTLGVAPVREGAGPTRTSVQPQGERKRRPSPYMPTYLRP